MGLGQFRGRSFTNMKALLGLSKVQGNTFLRERLLGWTLGYIAGLPNSAN